MLPVEGYEIVTSSIRAAIVGPLSSTALGYGGLSLVVAAVVVVAVLEPSGGGAGVNISGISGGYARRSATGLSSALIRLVSNV